MEWHELPYLFPAFERPGEWLARLERHAELLAEAAVHTRVTSVSAEEAVQRHYAESLEIWRIAVESAPLHLELVADIGSGGGFPGLVMACISPDIRFALVEPLQKRARLLLDAAAEMGLRNVEVVALRAEEAGRGNLREAADVVVARAVAPLPELLEYTVPFARGGGIIALPKGSGLEAELAGARRAGHILGAGYLETTPMRPSISETLSVAVFRKDRPTPKTYPRRPGMPRQKPL
ncbi:MAG: 16S rRNA (guanine(527)-N(7))-methyltransferase RsmG [bacterium]